MVPRGFSLFLVSAFAGLAVAAAAVSALAQGLPVPRFVSLAADEVNVRAGPSTDYPIEWVYVRGGVPVEIVAEFDNWRRVRDRDGEEGWVHHSLLSGKRTAVVTGGLRTLFRTPDTAGVPVLQAEAGVIGMLLACEGAWCRMEIQGRRGWLHRDEIWGSYPDEAFD